MQELERISAALDASALLLRAARHRRRLHRRHARRAAGAPRRDFPQMRLMPFHRNGGSGTARRIGTQEARGRIVVWTDADMTYPNERIPELVADARGGPELRPGRRRADVGGGHPQGAARAGEVGHPQGRRDADRHDDPRPQLRAAGLPPRRVAALPAAAAARVLLRHDADAVVPAQPARRALRRRSTTPSAPGTSKFHFTKDAYRYILQVLRMVMYFNPLKVLMPVALDAARARASPSWSTTWSPTRSASRARRC